MNTDKSKKKNGHLESVYVFDPSLCLRILFLLIRVYPCESVVPNSVPLCLRGNLDFPV
jgi:hypothetical protein